MIFGIGIDICEIERVSALLEKHGDSFVNRLFSEKELALKVIDDPRYIAKRFAAKEACAKALGTGIGKQLSFHDIHISRTSGERPKIKLSNKIQEKFPKIIIHLTISDEKHYAVAMAVAEKE